MIVSAAAALSVYLFVNAPPPLAAEPMKQGTVPIRTVFAMLERENDAARALWTEEIVTRGKQVGLAFDERWRDERVVAGPLPALFLRETAHNLERTPFRLGLFLGSPHPINTANQFSGEQAKYFDALVLSGAAQHFVDPSTNLQTAMFPDVAITDACASCHNEHKDSPKKDWKVNEVMGATTWMYPEATVTTERAIELVRALRTSIRRAYGTYLEKVATFPTPPQIGTAWPRDGFSLPSEDVFMRELARRSSTATLLSLLDPEATVLDETAPAPATAVVAPPAMKPAAVDHDTLVIRSTRATKVSVERDGRTLLVARIAAGGVATMTARLPLRVQLGGVDGIEIEYGGRKVPVPATDPSDHSKSVEIAVGEPNQEKS
ncbi:MAG: DUF4115 domain-containing protein [Kofleriaceae bacterium]|nr:DUF4115 domain-containing protein [Kofleriaceae bacterium]